MAVLCGESLVKGIVVADPFFFANGYSFVAGGG
jgi:hypothetical protein